MRTSNLMLVIIGEFSGIQNAVVNKLRDFVSCRKPFYLIRNVCVYILNIFVTLRLVTTTLISDSIRPQNTQLISFGALLKESRN